MSPGQVFTNSHLSLVPHSLGQCRPLQSPALQHCAVTHLPEATTHLPKAVTKYQRLSPTSCRSMLEPRSSSAVLLGRDRFRVRKRCSSPRSLAAHANVKPDPGKSKAGVQSSPPECGTWHGPTQGCITAGPARHAVMWASGKALPRAIAPPGAWQVGTPALPAQAAGGQAGHSLPAGFLKWVSMELGSLLLSASRRRRSDSSSSSSPGCCGSKRLLCSTASLRCSRSCVTLQEPSTTTASGTGTEGWGRLPQSPGREQAPPVHGPAVLHASGTPAPGPALASTLNPPCQGYTGEPQRLEVPLGATSALLPAPGT